MTLTEARRACRHLSGEGMRDTGIIRYECSWRVYATDPISGYRVHFDTIAKVDTMRRDAQLSRKYDAV